MTPPPRVETVREVIAAFAAGDAEAFVSHMTEDVVLRPSAFITGRGEYRGREDVLNGFAEMERDLRARKERAQVRPMRFLIDADDDSKVLALCQVTITRASGDEFGTETAYLCTVTGNKLAKLEAWLDYGEGLSRLGSPVEVEDWRGPGRG